MALLHLVLWFVGAARAQAPEPDAGQVPAPCKSIYAQAFASLHEAASALRLKVDTAPEEVARLFGERRPRCESGAYALYIAELMRFVRRAMRSGATPQTPKEGWLLGAQAAMGYAPREVPQAEYYDSLERFQAAKRELIALIGEAGAGPAPSALLPALIESMPLPGAYGPPTLLLVPREPPPEVEPAPAPLQPEAPTPVSRPEPAVGLADTYVSRATELYKAGNYLLAAEELGKAYLIRPKPVLLFNMAQAYNRGGQPRRALALYREFLTKDPQTPLLAETRNYIKALEALVDEQERAAQAKRQLQTEQSRIERVQMDLRAARARAEQAERERRRPLYRRGWFWGVLATGAAVAVGVGLGVGLAPRDPPTDGGIINLTF